MHEILFCICLLEQRGAVVSFQAGGFDQQGIIYVLESWSLAYEVWRCLLFTWLDCNRENSSVFNAVLKSWMQLLGFGAL